MLVHLDPLAASFAFLGVFMMAMRKRRLVWRIGQCEVCRRPKPACTCRYL
jgi:hypothetical protein